MAFTRTRPALAVLALAVTAWAAPARAERSTPATAESSRPSERKVFLNGVDLGDTEVTDKTFTDCTVRFDAHGNIYISVEGIKVEKKPAPEDRPDRRAAAGDKAGRGDLADPPPRSRPKPPAKSTQSRKSPPAKHVAPHPPGSSQPQSPPAKYFLITKESPPGATNFDVAIELNGRTVAKVRSGDASANAAVDITQYVASGDNLLRMTANKRSTKSSRSRSAKHRLTIMIGEGTVKDGTVTVTRTVLEYQRTAAETRNAAASYHFTAR